MTVHQCPDCELRFRTENELREHLDNDHPGRVGEHYPHPARHGANWPAP